MCAYTLVAVFKIYAYEPTRTLVLEEILLLLIITISHLVAAEQTPLYVAEGEAGCVPITLPAPSWPGRTSFNTFFGAE